MMLVLGVAMVMVIKLIITYIPMQKMASTFFCRVLRGNVCFECLQERVTQVRYTNAVM